MQNRIPRASAPGVSRGFTLIELLVVISIIAILAAILFPVFGQARERAYTAKCLSNGRQIGSAVRMYVDDWHDTWPIFQAYNTGTPHLGVEAALASYCKSPNIFACPEDCGGPALNGTGKESYAEAYGSSYRFTKGCFSVVNGVSMEDDAPVDMPTRIIHDGEFTLPASTRIIRDEMMPWADPKVDTAGKYYYEGWYRQWHSMGATVIFADGHAEFVTSGEKFDQEVVSPDGVLSRDGYGHGYD